jgi:hypothetical protein
MNNYRKHINIDILTLVAISIIAWALVVTLHEIVGHAIPAILIGMDVATITPTLTDIPSDQVSSDLWRSGTWRIIPAGGTVINFLTGAIALILLHFRKAISKSFQYFLWLFATFSFVIVIMYLASATAIGAGDWIQFVQEWEPINLYVGIIIGIGILFALPGYTLPLREWMPVMKGNRLALLIITVVPVFTLIITQILSALRSPFANNPLETSPLMASIFVCLHFVLWVILVNIIPLPRSSRGIESIDLPRSYFWLGGSIVVFILFVFIFGSGIGPFIGSGR